VPQTLSGACAKCKASTNAGPRGAGLAAGGTLRSGGSGPVADDSGACRTPRRARRCTIAHTTIRCYALCGTIGDHSRFQGRTACREHRWPGFWW